MLLLLLLLNTININADNKIFIKDKNFNLVFAEKKCDQLNYNMKINVDKDDIYFSTYYYPTKVIICKYYNGKPVSYSDSSDIVDVYSNNNEINKKNIIIWKYDNYNKHLLCDIVETKHGLFTTQWIIYNNITQKIGTINLFDYMFSKIYYFENNENAIVLEMSSILFSWENKWNVNILKLNDEISDVRLWGIFMSNIIYSNSNWQSCDNNYNNNSAKYYNDPEYYNKNSRYYNEYLERKPEERIEIMLSSLNLSNYTTQQTEQFKQSHQINQFNNYFFKFLIVVSIITMLIIIITFFKECNIKNILLRRNYVIISESDNV